MARAILWVSKDAVGDFFAGLADGRYLTARVQSSVPKDARLLEVTYDFYRDCWGLKFEHESFRSVVEGQFLPDLNPGEWFHEPTIVKGV